MEYEDPYEEDKHDKPDDVFHEYVVTVNGDFCMKDSDIQSVKAQLASMNKSFDDLKEALKNSGMEVRSSPQKEVHTAPNNTVNTPKGKNNVVVD